VGPGQAVWLGFLGSVSTGLSMAVRGARQDPTEALIHRSGAVAISAARESV